MTNIKIVPYVKELKSFTGTLCLDKICWIFKDGLDSRVMNEAYRIAESVKDGVPVNINTTGVDSESYTLKILPDSVQITAGDGAGAFYALKTLRQLMKFNTTVECCEITDAPDMSVRGFYHDVTRGKVPTLETLKKLVDDMSDYKLNMLQLYIEHTYEFAEYANVLEKYGYLTKAEIKELDSYCRERFIELVPSIATFGHLYELLMQEEYRHLCELQNYEPTTHYFVERMQHHTINPLLDESFEVIKSLIDQYLEVSASDKFNICCDETFDLGSDVNKNENKAELYVGFVKKLIAYLQSKGKTVMMWGDIILQHPEYIKDIPQDVIFLNWDYSDNVAEDKFKTFGDLGKNQLVCPGTSSWSAFTERVDYEEANISRVCEFGYRNNALGILNTNWGDCGHMCDISMSMYGMICGAAVGWRRGVEFNSDFRRNVSVLYYGDENIVELLAGISCKEVREAANWVGLLLIDGKQTPQRRNFIDRANTIDFERPLNLLTGIKPQLLAAKFYDEKTKEIMINALEGNMLLTCWIAVCAEKKLGCCVNYTKWRESFAAFWREKNKESELSSVLQLFDSFEKKRLAL